MLTVLLAVCMLVSMMSMTAMADSQETTYFKLWLESDETGEDYYVMSDESSHYLTEDTLLLPEVVALLNENYHGNGNIYGFNSPAMRDITDEGIEAYRTSPEAWAQYVDKYYTDVTPVSGDVDAKAILRDKDSTLGDLLPNLEHKFSFKNTVEGDPKCGVTYTLTIVRERPALEKGDHTAYITGYPDGSVHPSANITREEVAAIFYRLMTEESRSKFETTECSFADVSATRWSRTAIATLAAAGVITGRDAQTFDPAAKITRAEFAAIAARFDVITYDGKNLFEDIDGHWAASYINKAAIRGWVKGDAGTFIFRPDDAITRAEAVTLVNRVLDRAPETADDLMDGMISFTDNTDTGAWYYLAIQEAANSHSYDRKDDDKHESWSQLLN